MAESRDHRWHIYGLLTVHPQAWRISHSEDSHMKTTHYKSPWKWTFIHVSFKLVNWCILKQSHIFWMLSVMRVLVIHLQPQYGNNVVEDLCYCSLFLFFRLALPRYCNMIIYYPSFCQVDQPPILLHVMPLGCLLATILSALSFLSTNKIFPWVHWLGHVVDHPPLSSAKAKEGEMVYLCSHSGPLWPVLRWTFTTYKVSVAITFLNDVTFTHYISQCFYFNRFSDCGITSPYSLALRGLRFIWLGMLLCLCLCPLCIFQENILCFHPYLSLFKWMFICISHSVDSVELWYMVFPHLPGCKMTSNLR